MKPKGNDRGEAAEELAWASTPEARPSPITGGDDVLRPGEPTAPMAPTRGSMAPTRGSVAPTRGSVAPTRGSVARLPRAPLEQKGIVFPDVSYAQRGRIEDWDALAHASRGTIAMKVRQTRIDPFFSEGGLEEAERRGMIVIGYVFGYGVDGAEQADALLRNFRPREDPTESFLRVLEREARLGTW